MTIPFSSFLTSWPRAMGRRTVDHVYVWHLSGWVVSQKVEEGGSELSGHRGEYPKS